VLHSSWSEPLVVVVGSPPVGRTSPPADSPSSEGMEDVGLHCSDEELALSPSSGILVIRGTSSSAGEETNTDMTVEDELDSVSSRELSPRSHHSDSLLQLAQGPPMLARLERWEESDVPGTSAMLRRLPACMRGRGHLTGRLFLYFCDFSLII
jgi:hypothetical protein